MAGAAGGPVIALVSGLLGWGRRFPFLRKFGQQVSRLALYSSLVWIACLAGLAWWVQSSPPWRTAVLEVADWRELAALGAIVVCGLVFLAAYTATWKALKQRPLVHGLIGLISAAGMNIGLVWGLNLALVVLTGLQGQTNGLPAQLPSSLQPVQFELLWPAAAQTAPLLLGGAGVLAMVFLLLRRNRDDFGRDYYRFAVPCAARWSLLFGLQVGGPALAIPLMGQTAQGLEPSFMAVGLSACLLLLASAVLSGLVLRSGSPLRLKGSIVSALMTAWLGGSAALGCQVWLFGVQPILP
jgi:hypothetical protein